MNKAKVLAVLILSTVFFTACKNRQAAPKESVAEARQEKMEEDMKKKVDDLNQQYPKMPDEHMLDNGDGTPLMKELKKRYRDETIQLKKDVEASGAKLVYVIIGAEVGAGIQNTNRYGFPFIRQLCSEIGLDYVDFTPFIEKQDARVITQVPRDGHWSKKGAVFIADHLKTIIQEYCKTTSTATYKDSERPATFGDLPANDDEIRDGGKDMPYHVQANSQGMRIAHDITFPKKKKRVYLMGDSGFFCPFLDNEYTIAAVLQQMLPDYEIMINSAIGYTIEDYVTCWNDKAKYTEPDLVIVQTNGGDVTDLYFSHRNHFSRSGKPFYPSPNELKYYNETYPH